MPFALRLGPYRFFFWSKENNEPPHVHVKRESLEVKFWLEPVEMAQNWGFPRHELTRLSRMVQEHQQEILERWHDHFDQT